MLKPIRELQEKATAYYRRNMVGIDTVTLPGSGFCSTFTRCLYENPPVSKKQAKAMLEPIVDHLMDQVGHQHKRTPVRPAHAARPALPRPAHSPRPAHPLTHSPTRPTYRSTTR